MTALVTPFRDGRVDERALEAMVESQVTSGIHGLVPCGTTGESPTLTAEEQRTIIGCVVKAARGRVPVIAGAGSNSTANAIALSRAAKEAGVDGLLHITPYYNRPTQEGLYQHFAAIVNAVPLPTILYNVPGRTGCDLLPATVDRLADLPSIVGIKEATGSLPRAQQVLAKVGSKLALYSGEDVINYPLYAVGARGAISVVSNVAPKLIADVWNAALAHDHALALKLHCETLRLCDALFVESNPIPAKAALQMMGAIGPEIRLPLVPLSGPAREQLRAVLAEYGLL